MSIENEPANIPKKKVEETRPLSLEYFEKKVTDLSAKYEQAQGAMYEKFLSTVMLIGFGSLAIYDAAFNVTILHKAGPSGAFEFVEEIVGGMVIIIGAYSIKEIPPSVSKLQNIQQELSSMRSSLNLRTQDALLQISDEEFRKRQLPEITEKK